MQAEANLLERITQAYVASRGVRWFCALLVLVAALLLFVLAGGFPPYAWRLLVQALLQFPVLLAAHGPSALLALVGVLLLSLTILIIWGTLLWLGWRMLAYWQYERRELRNFAADLEEAQYRTEEVDAYADASYADDEDLESEQPMYSSAGRTSSGPSQPPATRRRVIYPLTPLIPQDEDDAEQAEAYAESENEQFFVEEEEEEENGIGIYRDEEEDEEGPYPIQPQRPITPVSPGPAQPMPAPRQAAATVYDYQIVEHSALSATASEAPAESIQHSSYGRILPFSAAPSVGALPHLTASPFSRIPLPRSVAPSPAAPPVASPLPPTRQPVAPSVQLPAPVQPVQPPAVPPVRPSGLSVIPTQPAIPASPLAQPAEQSAKPVPSVAPPQPDPVAEVQPAIQAVASPPTVPMQPPVQPAAPARQSAMQSLVELISTVPLVPPSRAPLSIVKPLARPDQATRQPTTQLVVSTGLDVGLKRRGKPNEDSLLALQNTRVLRGNSCPVGLFAVADGMGGHDNGQEASQLVIQSLSKTVVPLIIYGPTDENYSELLAEGVHHANLEVYQRNRKVGADMGTTIVAALVVDTTAYVVSAGDSRVYLYRAVSGLTQVTRDHSTVARLVESGLIKPEEVYTHPRRNEIYRSLGHHPSEDLDKFILALQPEDVLLLCSDGLWEMVRDGQIQEIIASTAGQPAQTSAALVQAALDGGGKDNISVIIIYVKAALGAQAAWAG